MIYNSALYVEKELDFQRKLFSIYKTELKGLPKGCLSTQTINGQIYYSRKVEGKRKFLGREKSEMVQALQKRHFLSVSMKRITDNIAAMERFIRSYKTIDPNILSAAFTKAYQPLPASCFDLSGSLDLTSWEKDPYYKFSKYPEELKHRTIKGELVRSKSEVIIANTLAARSIPYHYEEALVLSDRTIYPDFKIAVGSENCYRLLEHCGMLSDDNYLNNFLRKMKTYISNGYMPFIDVIFTFDDQKNNIDTQLISKIIDTYLL